MVFLCTVFASLALSLLANLLYWEWGFSFTAFQSIIVSQLFIILPALIYVVIHKINVVEFVRWKRIRIVTVIQLIFLAFMLMPVMSFISYVSMLLFENHIGSTVQTMVSDTNFLFCFLAIAVLPAIFEELVYRGVFYNEYSKYNQRKAILLSAFMFGLLHMNMNQFLYAFAMGVVFCLVIEATDSVLSTVIIHMTINGSSLVSAKAQEIALQFLKEHPEEAGDLAGALSSGQSALSKQDILGVLPSLVVPVLICTSLAVIMYYFIAKGNNRLAHVKGIFTSEKPAAMDKVSFMSPSLFFASIICIYCILVRG